MSRAADLAAMLPPVVSMGQALAAGLTPDQVRQHVRSGRWVRLSRGVYRTTSAGFPSSGWERVRAEHASRTVAEVLAHEGCRAGFTSAAVLHGLPVWRPLDGDVQLIAGAGGHNGHRPGVTVHRMELRDSEVGIDPVPISSVARTWFDVARTGRLVDGLVTGDAALRVGAMTLDEVRRVLDEACARRGVRLARTAAGHLDGTRETALESASWAYFIENDLPLPAMQVELMTRDGHFIARVDFLWVDVGLVGECDGRIKYEDRSALYAEKRREDAIRAEGYGVLRWGIEDLRGSALADRIRRVHARASFRSAP